MGTNDDWSDIAKKELRGKPLDALTWNTLEGIAVKPLYTADDTANLPHMGGVPGAAPFTRGVKATSTQAAHGRSANMRAFPQLRNPTHSTVRPLRAVNRAYRSRSIWRPTVATTVTTPALRGTWARQASPSTASRI